MVLVLHRTPGRESNQTDYFQLNQMYLLELENYQTDHPRVVPERVHRIHQSLLGREMQYHDYPVSSLRNVILHGFGLYMLPLLICFGG